MKDNCKAIDTSRDFEAAVMASMHSCKKVCFNLALLKKKDKVYSAYNIPRSEKILAFCKAATIIPLTIEGVVFTDQAVYRCPAVKLEDGSEYNRISYTFLDSCIITQEGIKGGIYVCTQNHRFSLYGPSLVAQNVAGYEIRQILCKVQHQLLQRDSAAKSKVDALASILLQQVKDEMGIEDISGKSLGILDCLMEFPDHADTAAMLKAEYIFREFRPEKYEKFAASLPSFISQDVKVDIKRIPSAFADNYIRLLTDLDREFEYRSLSGIDNRISDLEREDKTLDIIQAYLCIRMAEYERSNSRISELRNSYGAKIADDLEWFRCTFFYHEMFKVYQAIKNGRAYPKAYLKLRDGLGLTPLHYAIILRNETAMRHLLDQRDWKNASPYGSTALSFQMYEYAVSAAGNQLPNIQEVLLKTHAETIKLRNTIKTIKGKLKFQSAVHWIQDTNLFAHRMDYANKKAHHASKEDLERISVNIDAIKENLNTAEDNAANLTEMLRECEESIVYVMENAVDEALSLLEELHDKNHPLANYLYRVYFEPDFFEQVLRSVRKKQDLRLYRYKDFYFIAPAFAEINLPYQEQRNSGEDTKNEACISDNPTYGESWFSNEAHCDLKLLRLEYRKLAKEYHPDVSKHHDSNRLFQMILAEYNALLEYMT